MIRSIYLLMLIIPSICMAQIGGKRSYDFLNLPVNAQMTGLGGIAVTPIDGNYNQWLANPATMDSASWGGASVNFLDYFAGINYTNVSYIAQHSKYGGIGMGVQYLSHGTMDAYDPTGASLGTFDASEYAITVGHSRYWGPFQMGVNLKYVGSAISSFRSSALLMDIGGVFYPTESRLLTIGMAVRNVGVILKDYSKSSDSNIPFDVQLGISFKPQYMPIRFVFTAYNLTREDVVFFDQRVSGAASTPPFSEQIFRRLNIGANILLSENLQFQAGYNHLLRKEMRLSRASGGAGFSYGIMLKIKRIGINYGRGFYHVAGASNHISLNTNINQYPRKKPN